MNKREAIRMGCMGSGLRIREAAEGQAASRTIEGYAIVFDKPSVVMCDWWDGPFREYVDKGAITDEMLRGCDIKMTAFHDREILLARHWPEEEGAEQKESTLKLEVTDEGVLASFEAPKSPWGENILEAVRRGDMRGMSFTFYENAYTFEDVKGKDGIIDRHIKSFSEIVEMTIAADPAYPDTTAAAREREAQAKAQAEAEAKAKKEAEEREAAEKAKAIAEAIKSVREAAKW